MAEPQSSKLTCFSAKSVDAVSKYEDTLLLSFEKTSEDVSSDKRSNESSLDKMFTDAIALAEQSFAYQALVNKLKEIKVTMIKAQSQSQKMGRVPRSEKKAISSSFRVLLDKLSTDFAAFAGSLQVLTRVLVEAIEKRKSNHNLYEDEWEKHFHLTYEIGLGNELLQLATQIDDQLSALEKSATPAPPNLRSDLMRCGGNLSEIQTTIENERQSLEDKLKRPSKRLQEIFNRGKLNKQIAQYNADLDNEKLSKLIDAVKRCAIEFTRQEDRCSESLLAIEKIRATMGTFSRHLNEIMEVLERAKRFRTPEQARKHLEVARKRAKNMGLE